MAQATVSKWSDVETSIDLVEGAKLQLDFLALTANPALYDGKVLLNAIRRYEQCWLPLASETSPVSLAAPPLDVHWVWHCHMLSPLAYEMDCVSLVGKQVGHRQFDFSSEAFKNAKKKGKELWEGKYPDEPYEVSLKAEDVPESAELYRSVCKYNLADAVSRQKVFFYQVSLPHFRDDNFLKTGYERYQKYLFLKRQNPGTFLVPCYDMDLIWHSHQLSPSAYHRDTQAVLGRTLDHDDSVTDRSLGSKLSTSDDNTRVLWKETYQEDFPVCGAMFRGNPPHGKLYTMSPDTVYPIRTKSGNLKVTSLTVSGLDRSLKAEVSLAYTTAVSNRRAYSFLTLKGKEHRWLNDQTPDGLASQYVDTEDPRDFHVFLNSNKTKYGLSKDKYIATWLDFAHEFERAKNGDTISKSFQMLPKDSGKASHSGLTVDMQATVTNIKVGMARDEHVFFVCLRVDKLKRRDVFVTWMEHVTLINKILIHSCITKIPEYTCFACSLSPKAAAFM